MNQKQTNVICNVCMCPYHKEGRCSKTDVVIEFTGLVGRCKIFQSFCESKVWKDALNQENPQCAKKVKI
jgi:hypothetical protein